MSIYNRHFLNKNRAFCSKNINFVKEEEKKLSESFVSYFLAEEN